MLAFVEMQSIGESKDEDSLGGDAFVDYDQKIEGPLKLLKIG
jgi:hypothetical protein